MSVAVQLDQKIVQPVIPQSRLVIIGPKINCPPEEGDSRIAVVGAERGGLFPVLRGINGLTAANETLLSDSNYVTSAASARNASWEISEPEELTVPEYNLLQLFECSELWQDQETFRLRENAGVWAEFRVNVQDGKVRGERDDRIVSFRNKQSGIDNTINGVKSIFVKFSVSN